MYVYVCVYVCVNLVEVEVTLCTYPSSGDGLVRVGWLAWVLLPSPISAAKDTFFCFDQHHLHIVCVSFFFLNLFFFF